MTRDDDDVAALWPPWRLPADLVGVTAAILLTVAVSLISVLNASPIRVVVGLVFLLFVPGYAFIAALFPEQGSEDAGIDGLERLVLSFGSSIALVPLVGLVLNFTPWGIRLLPILLALGGLSLSLTATAAVRRASLPPTDRFTVPVRGWIAGVRAEITQPDSRTDAVLNVVLVLSVLLAGASVAYAVGVPTQGESFTEFYLLTENETGHLVADNYSTKYTTGEPRELVFGVANHEHERVKYTVAVELQRVDIQNGSVIVRQQERLGVYSRHLDDNETWNEQHTITPTITGTRLRLQYLLYRGDALDDPTAASAYRSVHLWVNVTQPADRRDTFITGQKV